MKNLTRIIESEFGKHSINFTNKLWHRDIPSMSGWYFIETNTPIEKFAHLNSPPNTYINENGTKKKCRNYNIPLRVHSIETFPMQGNLLIPKNNICPVYSGMTQNLMARAREHTFGHPGTAALALANYPTVTEYKWYFRFLENPFDSLPDNQKKIFLKFGEQIWRSKNGWPLLCAG